MSYKRCKSCSAPLLKLGQVRKHPDDYQHASGCPEGPARVLCCDPPWSFDDGLPGPKRGAVRNYKTLGLLDIQTFPLPPLERDCWLFLWRVAAMQEEALAVVRAWGFTPKSEVVWKKITKQGKTWFGMGRSVRAAHETCIIATRGKPARKSKSIRSVFEAPVPVDPETGHYIHSAKPEIFYTSIVGALSDGPYAELFARHQREGWQTYGDEL